jgi:hypothetical protein
VYCMEHSIGGVALYVVMPVARGLEDRIRDLCAQPVAAGLGELNPILSDLKAAVHAHTRRLTVVAASTLRPPREFSQERCRDATRAESESVVPTC